MKKTFIYLTLCLFPFLTSAQKEDNTWVYGRFNGSGVGEIKFDTGISGNWLSVNGFTNLSATRAVISSPTGQLKLYSNGAVVVNAQHDTIVNGTGLSPCNYTTSVAMYGLLIPQGALFLPLPKDSNTYYLFHTAMNDASPTYTLAFYYSIVNTELYSGKGAIIQKNVLLTSDSLSASGLTAVRHANGRDWWILQSDNRSNFFYCILLQPDGVHGPYKQWLGLNSHNDNAHARFTPDGNKYIKYDGYVTQKIFIYDFDRCTGLLSQTPTLIDVSDSLETWSDGDIAISPNSRFLYLNGNYTKMYQYDLEATNVAASRTLVATYDGAENPLGMPSMFNCATLAPDGKIYWDSGEGTYSYHVINAPDSLGLACNLVQRQYTLPGWGNSQRGMPNFPNFRLGAMVGSICDSLKGHTAILPPAKTIPYVWAYPNPAQDKITLGVSGMEGEKQMVVRNELGQIVYSAQIFPPEQEVMLSVVNFGAGWYFYELRNENEIKAGKFRVR